VKSAALVQSTRTESGPRHRHVRYLGSIREGHEDQHWHRVDFWAAVERNLNRAGITDAERKKIVADLQSAVPKPDAKSRDAANRELTRQEDRQKRGR
jgi:hypothetical protein